LLIVATFASVKLFDVVFPFTAVQIFLCAGSLILSFKSQTCFEANALPFSVSSVFNIVPHHSLFFLF
jgi:hypothetical protein